MKAKQEKIGVPGSLPTSSIAFALGYPARKKREEAIGLPDPEKT